MLPGGCAENLSDALPGDALAASTGHCVEDLPLAASTSDGGTLEEILLDRPFVARLGFVFLEPLGELISVVEDFLNGSGHRLTPRISDGRSWRER